MERKNYIDFMKGIAAVLVVIQHVFITRLENKSGVFIPWFHNPVFFIASGILFHLSLERQKDIGYGNLYLKSFLSLLLPFIIWNIIDISVCIIFKRPFYSITSNAAWFLAVLFATHCFIITIKDIKNKTILLIIPIFLLIGMIISSFYMSFLAKICTFTFIVYLGYSIEQFPPSKKASHIITGILLLLLAGLISLVLARQYTIEDGVRPGIRLTVNMIANIISACTVLFVVRLFYNLFEKLPLTKFFCLLGQYTMYIYLIPFLLTTILSMFCSNVIIHFLASILIPLAIGILIKGSIIDKILFKPYQLFMRK